MKKAAFVILAVAALGVVLPDSVPAAKLVPINVAAQPQSQVVAPSSDVLLSAPASGAKLKYQWSLNGEYIDLATGPTLLLKGVQPVDAGSYTVSIFDGAGSVWESPPVRIQVGSPAPQAFADQFAQRGLIDAASGVLQDSNVGAGREALEPKHAGKEGAKSVWIAWKAPFDGVATFSTRGSSFDTLLAVYQGESLAQLKEEDSDDDSGGFHTSAVFFPAQAGTIYQLAIAGLGKAEGNIVLSWDLRPFLSANPSIPYLIGSPADLTVKRGGTGLLAADYLNCTDFQWFFGDQEIPGATAPTLSLADVQDDQVGIYRLRLRTPDFVRYSQPIEVQINTEGLPARAKNKLEDAKKYPLRAGVTAQPQALNQPARRTITKSALPRIRPQLYDPVSGHTGTQIFATEPGRDPDEPNPWGVTAGASYWFCYEPAENGLMTLNTDGSSFDTLLAVYVDDGSQNGYASLITVSHDNNSGLDYADSALSFSATNGVYYFIVVDGVNGAYGTTYLNYYFLDSTNHAPVAVADSVTRPPNEYYVCYVPSLLGNDTDADNDTLSMSAVASRSTYNATLTRNGNSINYYPPTGFNSTDTFTYTLSDGRGGTATGTVTVLVGGGGE